MTSVTSQPSVITASLISNEGVDIHITGTEARPTSTLSTVSDPTPPDSAVASADEGTSPGISDEESYEDIKPDPQELVEGGVGAGISATDGLVRTSSREVNRSAISKRSQQVSATTTTTQTQGNGSGISTTPRSGASRRQSIPIILEETGKSGRYILTAGDPALRDLLRAVIEHDAEEGDAASKKTRARFQDMVFTRRFTAFDRQNPANSSSPFHGFFTLFWIGMGLLLCKVAAQNWRTYGSVLGKAELLHMMFDREVLVLGLTDVVMTSATIFGLGLQRLILKGYLTWERSGWIIQNLWQTVFIFSILGWTWVRDWPWQHSIFMILHVLVYIMKQHSYSSYNGYLSQVYRRRSILEEKLDQLESMEAQSSPHNSPSKPHKTQTSASTTTSIDMASSMNTGKDSVLHRRPSTNTKSSTDLTKERSQIASIAAIIDSDGALNEEQMAAFSRIIRREITKLTAELDGKSTGGVNAYPKNLTVWNWLDWTCLPTLVYELEYPRQETRNWWYVAEKTAATFGVLWCMMVISQAYIYPAVLQTLAMKSANMPLDQRWIEFPWIVSDMLFPLLLEQLLTWYLIWECLLNVVAEITLFSDRGFYADWWNAVSWDQYARDWNRPVHAFLLRHVYHSSISVMKLKKHQATLLTFFLSALVHELVMFVLFKKVRGYLFVMQLAQVPLAALSRTKLLKGRDTLGNVMFWFGLFVGPSVLTSLYLIV